ncbi:hypothetical protein O5O45_20445 [Hahella aquimaris]|uniref:hypothetical protein n=1 Tax=Hahella sp. HNIBRBA332 TaxID=3015983 RepID=UPI00273CD5F6|nr:hypothetical protein [Hahella sp. HNIBRBA332]WLQ12098.1 hypothetical protein O5O45_20445 [Hahella sp. HNIBRBA332]
MNSNLKVVKTLPERDDDPSILNEENLLRRVPSWPIMFKFDHNRNTHRLTSAIFSDSETNDVEISTTHKEKLLDSNKQLQDALGETRKKEGWGLVAINCGDLRNQISPPQKLVADPTEDDPFHTLIVGKKSKSVKRKMVDMVTTLIAPSPPNKDT